ncbi:hypothetical protein [Telluribacter sp. SYSU D00476]|uniref:hypothetical protein n=1 Tax=Telluribacter sp. SYSU D00476 TaxID=2811430 RepID=UPI001FF3C68F|nr:hypothetical protein [Telluribacter sp. SYSU D00476]
MKTFVISTIITLLLALVLPVTSARADNHMLRPTDAKAPKAFNVGMYRIVNSSKVSLAVAKHPSSRMTITLKDENGDVLYQENRGKGTELYKRKFDFNQIGNGTYYFEVEVDGQKVTKSIQLLTAVQQTIEVE